MVFFVVTVFRGSTVPGVNLPDVKKPFIALKDNQKHKPLKVSNHTGRSNI